MHTADLGDHIGMESCVDMDTDYESALSSGGGGAPVNRKPCRRSSMFGRRSKQLPPPMPIQSSTVMKRYHTDDGRLVITEEKIERPKFRFTAHRSHGRLTLQLVSSELSFDSENNSELLENEEEMEVLKEDECSKMAVVGGCGGGGGDRDGVKKCFSYNAAVRVAATGPCLFVNHNLLHAITPVKI